MSLDITALNVKDTEAIKRLYQEAFSGMELYYGRYIGDEFMQRRLFSSGLYSTDCSIVHRDGDRELDAAVFANLRKSPDQISSDSLYLNLILMKPDLDGKYSAKGLIEELLGIAESAGKRRVVTSLQWSGIWPGILSSYIQAIEICRDTKARLSHGEVFLVADISRTLHLAQRGLQNLPSNLEIRQYYDEDYDKLHQLMMRNFSIGWLHETLSKVSADYESFNGYGLAETYRPDDVLVVMDKQRLCGFCVVQSVTDGYRSFIGPLGMAPSYRGQGIGPHLFLKALEYLHGNSKKSVGLWTSRSIYQRFYSRFDMTEAMSTYSAEWRL